MSSFIRKAQLPLRIQKIHSREAGAFRRELVSLLDPSPDPFVTFQLEVPIDNLKELSKYASRRVKRKVSLHAILNKMIAAAISENPLFNQIVLGGNLYQVQDIHITNTYQIPETAQVDYVILENPHVKDLSNLQEHLEDKKKAACAAAQTHNGFIDWLTHVTYRHRLYRLIGERLTFCIAYTRGLMSNIILSNHVYDRPAAFILSKDIISPGICGVRIHLSGGKTNGPVNSHDSLRQKAQLNITVTVDHRVMVGVHMHQFCRTLETFAYDPLGSFCRHEPGFDK